MVSLQNECANDVSNDYCQKNIIHTFTFKGLLPSMNAHMTLETVTSVFRALDWRPGGPGFESRCGHSASELCQLC